MNRLSCPRGTRPAVLFSLALLLSVSAAEAVLTTATADTHVSAATPTQIFGRAETVSVNSQAIALIKFNLSSLPGGTAASQVSKATLHLWVSAASPNPSGELNIFPVSADWSGLAVTWNTKPAYLKTPKVARTLNPGGTNYYLEVDVTEIVKLWLTTPAKNFGVAVVAATPTLNIALDSKENTATSHPAILDVTQTGGKTFAVCLNGTTTNTCRCPGTLLNKVTGGSCQATSETGPCGAMAAGMAANHPLASCCVCAP